MNLATNTLAVVAPDGSFAGIAELWGSAPHVHTFIFYELELRGGKDLSTQEIT